MALANDSRYGLQAAVFTRDLSTALSVAYGLEAGGVIVNWSSAVRTENLPFGGLKMSGHGRESVHDTMLAMTEQKVILLYDVLDGRSHWGDAGLMQHDQPEPRASRPDDGGTRPTEHRHVVAMRGITKRYGIAYALHERRSRGRRRRRSTRSSARTGPASRP